MIHEKLDTLLVESLLENGFLESTRLEQICIPRIKSGRDLIAISGEKSGKTSTIVVSILNKLKASQDDNPRALILVPDTERAVAMKEEFDRLGQYTDLRVHTAGENERVDDQKDRIYMGSDVVIGTPKRLNQIYTLYALNLGMVKLFVIDDAELVIKSLNYAQIDRLSESLPRVQRVVFASQYTEWIGRFADEFMNVQDIVEPDESDEDDDQADQA